MSRTVGDPGLGGGDDRGMPGRGRRSRSAGKAGPSPLTVEQLVARQGVGTSRRRAARRADADRSDAGRSNPGSLEADRPDPAGTDLRRPTASPRPADVRDGLPPVPGAAATARTPEPSLAPGHRAGLPPVPAGARPVSTPSSPPPAMVGRAAAPVPAAPPLPGHPSLPLTDLPYAPVRPTRKTGPVPPLPGTVPAVPGGTKRPRPPKPERSPRRRRFTRAAVALAAVLGVIVLYGLGLYFYVDRSIGRVDALASDGPEVIAPELQDGAETFLVVGTGVPGQQGAASVTSLLATVSGDGERAVLLSLPPSAMVDTPECRTSGGDLREARTEALAVSLLDGGPSCLVRVVQQLSGLHVDHYLAMDLDRLPSLVDALGDVPVCVPGTVAAGTAARPLPVGDSSVTAEDVAGWLRPAEQAPDATGAMVSQRTQLLVTSTLRAALTAGTLADPVALTRFLSRAADALTVDDETTLGDLRELAASLGDLSGTAAVQQAELPVTARDYVPAGSQTPFVLLDPTGTASLFETVIRETRVPEAVLAAQAEAEAAAAASLAAAGAQAAAEPEDAAAAPTDPGAPQPLTVAPSDVTVDVLNATATAGLAATVADELTAQGFSVGEVGNDTATLDSSIVRHGPAATEQARTVAAALPGAQLQVSDQIGSDAVQLVLGPGSTDVAPVQMLPAAAAEQAEAGATQAAPSSAAPTAAAAAAPASCS